MKKFKRKWRTLVCISTSNIIGSRIYGGGLCFRDSNDGPCSSTMKVVITTNDGAIFFNKIDIVQLTFNSHVEAAQYFLTKAFLKISCVPRASFNSFKDYVIFLYCLGLIVILIAKTIFNWVVRFVFFRGQTLNSKLYCIPTELNSRGYIRFFFRPYYLFFCFEFLTSFINKILYMLIYYLLIYRSI